MISDHWLITQNEDTTNNNCTAGGHVPMITALVGGESKGTPYRVYIMSLYHITKTESDNDPPVPPHRFTFDGRAITFIYCEPWNLFTYHDCGELYLFITCIEMQPLIKEEQNWWELCSP